MLRRAPFIHKLLGRLERVDRKSVESYLADLAQESSLYAEILDHLNEGVLLATESGRVIYANRQASLWLGMDSKDQGRAFLSEVVQDRDLGHFITSHLKTLNERVIGEVPMLVPREMNLRVTLVPLEARSEENEILILLANTSEEKNRAEENFSPIEALASLAAGIAHEIGNPLNSISIHLELLRKEMKSLPEAKKKFFEKTLNVLNSETSRLDRMVRNFLRATRKPPLRFKSEDLNQILEDAVRFMAPELRQRKVKVDLQLDKTMPPFMLDRERLYQAFINLIKNAMESMSDGGRLEIKSARREKIVSLSFKDDGGGIHEADLPHIFEAYYTTKEEGSGLGLMTVYNVVREHGGRIEVTSKPGKGSLFVLHLPIRQPKLQLPQYKKV